MGNTSADELHVWGRTPEPIIKLASQIPRQVEYTRPYEQLVCSYDWNCEMAMRIMKCESSYLPRNYAANNYGLFQINGIHVGMTPHGTTEDLYDPTINVDIAYRLYLAGGWTPWLICGG